MNQWMHLTSRHGLAALIALMGTGCAGYGPQGLPVGASQQMVIEKMGAPTAEHPPEAGAPPTVARRLEYARGPFGKHTYMLDMDAQGRLLSWQQVLTESRFAGVVPGMSDSDVLHWLGRPAHVRQVGWRGQTVWSYRFQNSFCVWFEVSIEQAKVVETGEGPDPQCEAKERGHRDRPW